METRQGDSMQVVPATCRPQCQGNLNHLGGPLLQHVATAARQCHTDRMSSCISGGVFVVALAAQRVARKRSCQRLQVTVCRRQVLCEAGGAATADDLNRSLQFFGISSLRREQHEVISAALSGQNSCVFWATAAGKSLCYQLPAVQLRRTVLVVSPLISLMNDQVNSFNDLAFKAGKGFENIKACLLGSAQEDEQVERDAIQGKYCLVFVTPEKLSGSSHMLQALGDLSKSGGLALVAVDEAHCISEWGYDFRPAYRELWFLREECPTVPFMALTAVSTPLVHDDIFKYMRINREACLVSKTSVDRPNLFLKRSRKKPKYADIRRIAERVAQTQAKTIVYARTKAEADRVFALLEEQLDTIAKVYLYHGDMDKRHRRKAQEGFASADLSLIVATSAFGLGINLPDVRQIFHYEPPYTVEQYFQQIGRAGRDGKPATCELICCDTDFEVKVENRMSEDWELTSEERLRCYASGNSCRRRWLLEYFNEKPSFGESCGNCDICLAAQRPVDLTAEARLMMDVVLCCEGAGLSANFTSIVSLLSGKLPLSKQNASPKLPSLAVEMAAGAAQLGMNSMKKSRFKDLVQELVPFLVGKGFLRRQRMTSGPWFKKRAYQVFRSTVMGRDALSGSKQLVLPVPPVLQELLEERLQTAAPTHAVQGCEGSTVAELKVQLRALGLKVGGNKQELKERLLEALHAS